MSRIICLIATAGLIGASTAVAQDVEAENPLPLPVAGVRVEVDLEVDEFDPPRDPNPLIDFIIRADENVKFIGEVLFSDPALVVNQIDKNELRLAFKGMADPIVERDFKFVRMICKPDAAQAKKLGDAQSAVRKRMVDALVEWQTQSLTATDEEDAAAMANPYAKLKWNSDGEVRKAVQDILTPQQLAELDHEWKQRNEFQRSRLTRLIVSELDEVVLLNPEQRETIRKRVTAQFQENWLMFGRFNEEPVSALGMVPEKVFMDLLTDDQKLVWSVRPDPDSMGVDFFVDEMVDLEAAELIAEPIKLPEIELPEM